MLYQGMNGRTAPLTQQYNPYMMPQVPQYDIVKVNGANGANAFQMGPNSKILLLDENNPIVWYVETDGAGYKTVTPYDISLHQDAPPVDLNSLEARIALLEEKINAKSNSGTNSKGQKRQSVATSAAAVPVSE